MYLDIEKSRDVKKNSGFYPSLAGHETWQELRLFCFFVFYCYLDDNELNMPALYVAWWDGNVAYKSTYAQANFIYLSFYFDCYKMQKCNVHA